MTAPLLAIIAGLIVVVAALAAWNWFLMRELNAALANLRRQRIDTSLHTATMRWRT